MSVSEKKKSKLLDLQEELCNCEDCLDGCYNEEAYEVSDCVELNKTYLEMLSNMRKLSSLINREFNQ